jgi:hypothetical protein
MNVQRKKINQIRDSCSLSLQKEQKGQINKWDKGKKAEGKDIPVTGHEAHRVARGYGSHIT